MQNDDDVDFRVIITALREAGLSQTQIAEKVGASQANISRIGNGQEPTYNLGHRLIRLRCDHFDPRDR